jgi:hypothetical protein
MEIFIDSSSTYKYFMIYTSENNWYYWNYGNEKFERRSSKTDTFSTGFIQQDNIIVRSFKEELLNTARSTLDHYPGLNPCVFFSGGVDSEAILRAYIEIGSNPSVYIIRYEKDYNIYDVSYAISICNSLSIPYNLIDFNLEKFYENDAVEISDQAQIDRPRMLPHLKFTECADGLIIVGHSDMYWYRTDGDYSKKGTWLVKDFEHDIGCDKYTLLKNRSAIYQWWKWNPGIMLSYIKMSWFQKLISDQIPRRQGTNSTKINGFREAYPDMIARQKQTGFEKIELLIEEVENCLIRKNDGLIYRGEVIRSLDKLTSEIGIKI